MDIKVGTIETKVFIFLLIIIAILLYNPAATLSDGHIPPQEQQPAQTESTEIPSPKQLPSTQDTETKTPQQTQPSEETKFPTKIEVPQKLPSTKDLKDIEIKQPSGGTQLEQPIPVPDIKVPEGFTPKSPSVQISYSVLVSDCVTKLPLQGADVELKYFNNKQNQISNAEGLAKFDEIPAEGIELGDVEIKKQGYNKAEISTSIPASKTDKICVSKELIVAKPTEPPVVVSGPKEPVPTSPTQPPVVSQPTDTSQTPTPTPVPIGTDEQPPIAQAPEHKKHLPHEPEKDKPPIDIDTQAEETSIRSEELIYEEEVYPETVVGDPVANKIETDEKIGTVARLLRDKKRSQITDNKDDDLTTKGGELSTQSGVNQWQEEPLNPLQTNYCHTWEETTLAIYQNDPGEEGGTTWAENVTSREGVEGLEINGINSLINKLRDLKYNCKCVKYMVILVHGNYAVFRIGPIDGGQGVRVGYYPNQIHPTDFGTRIEPYLCRHPRIRLMSCGTAGQSGNDPRDNGNQFIQDIADASRATVTGNDTRCYPGEDYEYRTFDEGNRIWQATPGEQQPHEVDRSLGPDWVPGYK